MVAQGDLVAPQLPGLAVQESPPHPGAQVAGILLHLIRHIEDVAAEHGDGDAQPGGVLLDQRPVGGGVAGIHHQEGQLEGLLRMALELLHQLGQHHGVLPSGDTHGDPVPGDDQLIPLDGGDEGIPQLLAVFFDEAALGSLLRGQFTGHGFLLKDGMGRQNQMAARRRREANSRRYQGRRFHSSRV